MARERNKDIQKAVGRRLYLARHQHGKSQKQIAEAVGVDYRTVSAYENGILSIDTEMLIQYCRALGMTPNQLLKGVYDTNGNNMDSAEPLFDADDMTQQEMDLIAAYRRRPEWLQRAIRAIVYENPSYLSREQEFDRDCRKLYEEAARNNDQDAMRILEPWKPYDEDNSGSGEKKE